MISLDRYRGFITLDKQANRRYKPRQAGEQAVVTSLGCGVG